MLALPHPHPHRACRIHHARHQAAIGHHPGEHGLRRSYHEPLQDGVDTVRPDHHVCRGRGPVREADRRAASILAETRAPMPGPHYPRWQLPGQQRQQVGPVDPDVLPWPGELIRLVAHRAPVGEPESEPTRTGRPSARSPRRPRADPASAGRSAPATRPRRPRPAAAPAHTPGRRSRPAPARRPPRSRRSRRRQPPPAVPRPSLLRTAAPRSTLTLAPVRLPVLEWVEVEVIATAGPNGFGQAPRRPKRQRRR